MPNTSHKAQLIVALDVDSLAEVRDLVDKLSPAVDMFKIGSQLFTASGPAVVRFVLARGKKVFLDLKFHDIPNTVASAVRSAVGLTEALERTAPANQRGLGQQLSVSMFTVHTIGGVAMMKAAVESAEKTAQQFKVIRPLVVGVTVLTSDEKKDNLQALVLERARMAKEAGLDGVVASVEEAAAIRKEFGKDFVIVTPGIRPVGADKGDQKRIATPSEAIKSGSNYLVVGRPILEAPDPVAAAKNILKEIGN
jgi:orotidine-5'-phosphate decarboxylase